jgi:hypothetical protein
LKLFNLPTFEDKLNKMETRDAGLLSLRKGSLGELKKDASAEELFQNNTLRPILKLQNDVLLAIFTSYIQQQKNSFYDLGLAKKSNFIDNALQKDITLKNTLKGIVIGLFTQQEYIEYATNSSAINKRMMGLIAERLKSQLQLLEGYDVKS